MQLRTFFTLDPRVREDDGCDREQKNGNRNNIVSRIVNKITSMVDLIKVKTSGSDDVQSTANGIENINSVQLIISNRRLSFMQYICSKAARTGVTLGTTRSFGHGF